MIALSPTPQPSVFERINRWSGWSGLALAAAILGTAGVVLVVSSKIAPAAAPPVANVAAAPPIPLGYTVSKGQITRNARTFIRNELPEAGFDSVRFAEIDGKRVFVVRVVPRGPTIVLDAETGEVVEQREPRPLLRHRIPDPIPVS